MTSSPQNTAPPPSVIFCMADYGHDPTETALPYQAFIKAGYTVHFATETGTSPECDEKMLTGMTQKLLGAPATAVVAYRTMRESPAMQSPLSWSAPDFSLDAYTLLFLPGGHEKGVRQALDSRTLHKHVAEFFPQTLREAGRKKAVAAVCHGVMVLSEAERREGDGKSVLFEATTTALPHGMEQAAFWGTRLFLGDYYKTYGAGSESVEEAVRKKLKEPERQWKGSMSMSPFVVHDPKYNYISARFPGDVPVFAEKVVEMVERLVAS